MSTPHRLGILAYCFTNRKKLFQHVFSQRVEKFTLREVVLRHERALLQRSFDVHVTCVRLLANAVFRLPFIRLKLPIGMISQSTKSYARMLVD